MLANRNLRDAEAYVTAIKGAILPVKLVLATAMLIAKCLSISWTLLLKYIFNNMNARSIAAVGVLFCKHIYRNKTESLAVWCEATANLLAISCNSDSCVIAR
jgi:hypothetical protein